MQSYPKFRIDKVFGFQLSEFFSFQLNIWVTMHNILTHGNGLQKPVTPWRHPSCIKGHLFQRAYRWASNDDKPQVAAVPAASTVSEMRLARSIATRLLTPSPVNLRQQP